MGKKKVFRQVLSFFVVASLVHVPIVCAVDPQEPLKNQVRFWIGGS
ncbi:MAG: hypothetical protein LBJ83_01995 [Oscillospiraceae bacterium]|nr:hypothetical protein [Oscillospiraceae bacterium]